MKERWTDDRLRRKQQKAIITRPPTRTQPLICPPHTDTHRHRWPLTANKGRNISAIYTTIKGNISNNCAYCTMKISYFRTICSCVRVWETHTGVVFSNMCSMNSMDFEINLNNDIIMLSNEREVNRWQTTKKATKIILHGSLLVS